MILLPGIVGGLAIALFIARFMKRGSEVPTDRALSTDINIARIRAAGIGGLGLFAMALVVAWFVPRIGQTLSVGTLLGAVLGVVLILRRRRAGPLPSSSGTAGANAVLSIDHPASSKNDDAGGTGTSSAPSGGSGAHAVPGLRSVTA